MRILVDEDLPAAVADLLRSRGYDAEHVREAGLAGASDRAIFAAAQAKEAVLVTADLDFANPYRIPGRPGHGILVLRFPDYFRRHHILAVFRRFLDSVHIQSLVGKLVVVEPGGYRVMRR